MSPEEEQEMSPEEEQEMSPEEGEVEVSPQQEQALEEKEQALSPEEEASIEAAQQQQPEASPEWPEEEQEGDLEIVTVGQQEYFRTSNNGLFTVIRDEEGNPDIGSWAGVLSDDGTQVVETEQPEEP
jgi:ATP-dependent exoDNAse (exonuclease V) alpha subunit